MNRAEYYTIKAFMDAHKDIDNMVEVSSVASYMQKGICNKTVTTKQLEDMYEKYKKLLYIAFLHPDDAEAVKACLPRIEEEIVIQPTPFVEKGKGVCIKREDLESWATPHINDLFED